MMVGIMLIGLGFLAGCFIPIFASLAMERSNLRGGGGYSIESIEKCYLLAFVFWAMGSALLIGGAIMVVTGV
jgi:hypothetical protein